MQMYKERHPQGSYRSLQGFCRSEIELREVQSIKVVADLCEAYRDIQRSVEV